MKQDERLQELADMKLALAVLSVQSAPFSVPHADPADDKIDRSFAQRAVLAMRHIPGQG